MKKILAGLLLLCLFFINIGNSSAYDKSINYSEYVDQQGFDFIIAPDGHSPTDITDYLNLLGDEINFDYLKNLNRKFIEENRILYNNICENRNCDRKKNIHISVKDIKNCTNQNNNRRKEDQTNINICSIKLDKNKSICMTGEHKDMLGKMYIARKFLYSVTEVLANYPNMKNVPIFKEYIEEMYLIKEKIDIARRVGKMENTGDIIDFFIDLSDINYHIQAGKKQKIKEKFRSFEQELFEKNSQEEMARYITSYIVTKLYDNLNEQVGKFEYKLRNYKLKKFDIKIYNELANHNLKVIGTTPSFSARKTLELIRNTDKILSDENSDIRSFITDTEKTLYIEITKNGLKKMTDIEKWKKVLKKFTKKIVVIGDLLDLLGLLESDKVVNLNVQVNTLINNATNFVWMNNAIFSDEEYVFETHYSHEELKKVVHNEYVLSGIGEPKITFSNQEKNKENERLESVKKAISNYIKNKCFERKMNKTRYDFEHCPSELLINSKKQVIKNMSFSKNSKDFRKAEILIPNYKDIYKCFIEKEPKPYIFEGEKCFKVDSYPGEVKIHGYKFDKCSEHLEIPDYKVGNSNLLRSGKKYKTIIGFKLANNSEGKHKLKSVKTGDYLTWIEFQMFANYGIEKLKLGKRIEKLVDESFKNNNIKEVTLPKSLSKYGLGREVFMNNKLERVVFEQGGKLSSIQERAFKNNNIQSLILSDNIKYINTEAFMNNKLFGVVFPKKILGFGPRAFMNNNLESITFPPSTQYISDFAFANNNLKKISFSGSVKISRNAFDNNNLEVVSLPKNIELIVSYGENKGFPFSNNCLRRENLDATTLKVFDGFNKEWEKTQKSVSECNKKATETKSNREKTNENTTTGKITISERMKKKIDIALGNMFLKIDKKGEAQAQKTYKLLLVKIKKILKKEMKQSTRSLIEYIQMNIEEKID